MSRGPNFSREVLEPWAWTHRDVSNVWEQEPKGFDMCNGKLHSDVHARTHAHTHTHTHYTIRGSSLLFCNKVYYTLSYCCSDGYMRALTGSWQGDVMCAAVSVNISPFSQIKSSSFPAAEKRESVNVSLSVRFSTWRLRHDSTFYWSFF